jgi:hypothetical protein
MMTRRLAIALCAAGSAAALVPAAAPAATPAPTITFFSPRQAEIGTVVTVRGRHYIPGVRRTSLVLLPPSGGPAIFVKADSATRTRLKVRVPARLLSHLTSADGELQRTRFRLRVVARRAGERFTPARSSLTVIPPANSPGSPAPTDPALPQDCDGDGQLDGADQNDDGDLLSDAQESSIGTQLCNADSDGDGLEDGYEFYAAKDLNLKAVPYPGRRPYPNALDGSDRNLDFDGDGLTLADEHELWVFAGKRFDPAQADAPQAAGSPLFYSDGTQRSTPTDSGGQPAFRSAEFGVTMLEGPTFTNRVPFRSPAYPQELDQDGDGQYSDDERDADRDGLTNHDESHGDLLRAAWDGVLAQRCDPAVPDYGSKAAERDPAAPPTERNSQYVYWGPYNFDDIRFLEPSFVTPDTDGDGLLDGEDDQDHDDVPNVYELDLRCEDPDFGGPVRNVHPYNPCAPRQDSRSCRKFIPLG